LILYILFIYVKNVLAVFRCGTAALCILFIHVKRKSLASFVRAHKSIPNSDVSGVTSTGS
jgi:hypothetical protein